MGHVLLVEDDPAIAQPLARALARAEHRVTLVEDGPTALDRALAGGFDVMVLDLGLPGMDGLEVCRGIRREDARLPILVLTARTQEIDVVMGLRAGADDYVTKPFRPRELMARVDALVRRTSSAVVPRTLRVQDVVIHIDARKVYRNTDEISLSRMEFDLLYALMNEAGTTVTRERLMREVWRTHWFGSSKTLDMHVSWLRRKLGDSATDSRYITTVRGVGLRFEQDEPTPDA